MTTEKNLRRGMSVIAETLEPNGASDSPRSGTATATNSRPSRWRKVGAASLVAGVAAILVVTIGFNYRTPGTNSPDAGADAGRGLSYPETVACAKQIFVGTVTNAQQRGDRNLITFSVKNWIKPDAGPRSIRVNLPTPPTSGDLKRFRVGDYRWLLSISQRRSDVADAFSGRSLRFTTRLFEDLVQKPDQPPCPLTDSGD